MYVDFYNIILFVFDFLINLIFVKHSMSYI